MGSVPVGTGPMSLAIDPSGRFAYVGDISSDNLVLSLSIDPASGILTNTGSLSAFGTYPYPVIVDPSGKFVFAADIDSNVISTYTIDPDTGRLTSTGVVNTPNSPGSLLLTTVIQ